MSITLSGGIITSSILNTSINIQDVNKDRIKFIKKIKVFGITIYKKFTYISVHEFFKTLKENKKHIKIVDGLIKKYTTVINNAQMLGQTALVEQLTQDIFLVKKEIELVCLGLCEYLTLNQIQKLMFKSHHKIHISSIKNFCRPIPDKVKENIIKVQHVFDDIKIIHYDINGLDSRLTKKQIEEARDPIVCGIINGYDNYYYIDD